MFGLTMTITDTSKAVLTASEKATARNIRKSAFRIYQDAAASIKPVEGPSRPGTPPHTHTQKLTRKGRVRKGVLPKAINYSAEKTTAVIGARHSVVGLSAEAHEKGKFFKGHKFDERAFMVPALEREAPNFANSYAGSIG
jgi:hypothetical protein